MATVHEIEQRLFSWAPRESAMDWDNVGHLVGDTEQEVERNLVALDITERVVQEAIGSVHYISPEQAKGERTDARTDIYSVGVMLYEMLSGRLPFDGDGAVSIAIMQISEKPKPLAEIAPQTPAGLRQITEKAMEKDPDKRYQSAQEMLAAIEEFKRNPSIQFAYEYRSAEDNPERNINRVVSNTKPSQKSTSIHTGDARRVGTSNPGRSKSAQKKKKKASKGFSLLPIFFGMAVAFVIGAAILIYLIFTNSSNLLFSNRADVQVISFVGMTKDEFLATDYNNLLRAEFPEEYSSEPAGTIIRQTPKAGRTVKEKQRIVLTVSLGTQYVTIPETKNMVAEDAEQTLKDMGLRVTKKPMSDNSVANGAVVYTQPAAGETVEGDSTVILYVSRSEVSKESQVPSLTGKTIEEAMEVTHKAVMEALDGLPPVKIHCSLLAEEAIHAALWDYAEKHHIKIEGLSKPKSDIHEGEEDTEEEY